MKIENVLAEIAKWGGTINFFPSDAEARLGIAESIGEMAGDEDKIRWLVRRVAQLHRNWPGIMEVRAILCSKYRPVDGIEVYSDAYPDGIPSEKWHPLAIVASPAKQLQSGQVSRAQSIQETVLDLANATNIKRVLGPPPVIRPIPTRQLRSEDRITQEMIDAAVAEVRAKRLAVEFGSEAVEKPAVRS